MLQGHLGAALLVSGLLSRPLPLPLLFLLTQVQDIVISLLVYVLRIEKSEVSDPPNNAVLPFTLIYIPYSHGLIPSLAYSVLAALPFRTPRERLAAAAVVMSHWILDFIVHVPDLDVCFPFAVCPKVGLGLWRFLWPSVIVESLVCVAGAAAYLASVNPAVRRPVALRLAPLVAFMLAMTAWFPFIPPPENPGPEVAVQSYVFYVLSAAVAWAIERPTHRPVKRD